MYTLKAKGLKDRKILKLNHPDHNVRQGISL
jgi:hypothetical protein